jgi:hypothetical protein
MGPKAGRFGRPYFTVEKIRGRRGGAWGSIIIHVMCFSSGPQRSLPTSFIMLRLDCRARNHGESRGKFFYTTPNGILIVQSIFKPMNAEADRGLVAHLLGCCASPRDYPAPFYSLA